MWWILVRYMIVAFVVVVVYGEAHAQSQTFEVVDTSLYRLLGQGFPVVGYKIKSADDANFLGCDGTKYHANSDKLIKSAGFCGDSKGGGVTLFTIKWSVGDNYVSILSSNVPELKGANATVSAATLKSNFSSVLPDSKVSKLQAAAISQALITTNDSAIKNAISNSAVH